MAQVTRLTAKHDGAKVTQMRRQITEIEINIESMRASYRRIGERSDWQHPSLDARYDDICFWEDRVSELRRQLRRLERVSYLPQPPTHPQPAA